MSVMSLQRVGRYEIISELGRGAMGVVYKALDPTIGRTVALKTMRVDVHGLETEDVLRRFKNEARASGMLSNPNIVTIYDAGEQDGMVYIAMEYIEGTTLHSMLAERRVLPADEVIQLSRQICKGLDYAHSHEIIHRDVKPANIMITANGTVKIMDFGIAKAGGGMTSTGQVLGTPNYMSPEQVKGKTLDGRSDLFSFGVILYEMITGEKPFVGQNVTTIIYKIVHENPIAPRDLDVTIHPGLSAVVTKSLAKLPEERYQNGAALVHDLENYKSIGSNLGATVVIAPGQSEQTQVLATGSGAAAAAAPARVPPSSRLNIPVLPRKPHILELVLITAVLVLSVAAGITYYVYRATQRQHAADVDLEHKIQEQQIQQASAAAAIKASEAAPLEPATDAKTQPEEAPRPAVKKAAVSPHKVSKDQGELRFSSQPAGAKVEVDGWNEPTWITPFRDPNITPGTHNIVFSKPGFMPEKIVVTVVPGNSKAVSAQLNPAVSKVIVGSTPSGASVIIDGRDTGKITPAEISLEKGRHEVLVRKAGYKEVSTTETLADGQTLNYSPVLLASQQPAGPQLAESQQPLEMSHSARPGVWKKLFGSPEPIPAGKGLLRIHTEPEGASIQIDDRGTDKKTNVKWPAPPGTYDVTLSMDGYKPIKKTVHVQAGQEVIIDETLEKR